MSLISAINPFKSQPVNTAAPAQMVPSAWGGGVPNAGPGAAMIGGQMAQPRGIGSVLKNAMVGAAGGGALGAGVGLLPAAIPFVGLVSVPMGAMVGAAAGGLMGIFKGVRDIAVQRKQLGMMAQQQQQIQPGAGVSPLNTNVPMSRGKTFGNGATGSDVRYTQRTLKKLGLLSGKISGTMDTRTVAAVKRYEVMKGVIPTGMSTPDLRQALSQDVRLARQAI